MLFTLGKQQKITLQCGLYLPHLITIAHLLLLVVFMVKEELLKVINADFFTNEGEHGGNLINET